MKSYRMSKLSASLVVLVMALSAILVVVPAQYAGQATSGVNIYVPVRSGGVPVIGAYVNLTEVHTGAIVTTTYDSSRTSYKAAGPEPGFYRVDVVAPNCFTKQGAALVVFTGLKNVTVSPITLTPFPTKTATYTVTVVSGIDGTKVTGATVGFYNRSYKQFVAVATSNSTGVAVLTMYSTSLASDVSLVAIKGGFETYAAGEVVAVNSTVTRTITLSAAKSISAYVEDSTGIPAQNVVAYLINTDSSVIWFKRVLRTTGNLFSFDAYTGTFTLVVDSPGNNAYVQTGVTAPTDLGTIHLHAQNQRVEHVNMTFAANYSSFTLGVSTEWNYDDAYPGLAYSDMGSLRAQVDLVMGDGNGVLSSSEISAFNSTLSLYGTQYVTSTSLLEVNSTMFLNGTASGLVMNLSPGPVNGTNSVKYSYSCAYTANGAVAVDGPRYILNATANMNSASVDHRYMVFLVNYSLPVGGYVRVPYDVGVPAGAVVSGYKIVTYDANVTGTGSELIQLKVEKSKTPIAGAAVSLPSQNASSVLNKTKVLLRYIVRQNANVTFNATGSSDPNGNPLTYVWNFTDGSVVTTTNSSIVHKFLAPFVLSKVNLTVRNQAGQTNFTLINVTCDGRDPTPMISARMGRTVAHSGMISVNQSELVIFNATKSTDDAVTSGDHQGLIDHVSFDYGDKNVSGPISWSAEQNRTHAYPDAGNYTVVLNVTDSVGHWKNTTLKVHVNDTAPPIAKFTYKNSTWGATITENTTVTFNANATRDNVDNYTVLNYSWNFGDKTPWNNGTGNSNVTHSYAKIGEFTVTMKVTDRSHNNVTFSQVVTVASEPRPNLVISKVYFDPANFTQGSTGYIYVNITNTGNANATNVLVQFYIVPDNGGPLQKIGETSSMLNGTASVSTILPGGKVQVKFAYNPSSTGTLTLKVNATAKDQLKPFSYTCSGSQALHVKEAPYKALLLWIGVAVIIVAIPSLLYVRSRWMKREKKGPRRERRETKEKEPKEDEEL